MMLLILIVKIWLKELFQIRFLKIEHMKLLEILNMIDVKQDWQV